jgi:hypothetical protein
VSSPPKKAPRVSEIDQLLAQVGASGGVLIEDVPEENPDALDIITRHVTSSPAAIAAAQGEPQATPQPPPAPMPDILAGPPVDRGPFTIEHRIRITEAWQYPGYAHSAPDWIDRNWIGYADHDPVRGIEPGPCLRIPGCEGAIGVTICRIGDWVARQQVTADDQTTRDTLAVWPREQFERFFVNVRGLSPEARVPTPPPRDASPPILPIAGLQEQDLAPLNDARKTIHEAQRNIP